MEKSKKSLPDISLRLYILDFLSFKYLKGINNYSIKILFIEKIKKMK